MNSFYIFIAFYQGTNNMVNANELRVGQRYLFRCKPTNHIPYFRANFIKIIVTPNNYSYLKLNMYEFPDREIDPNVVHLVTIEMITKIETLSDVLDNNHRLPDDVLHLIDNYY